MTRRGKTVAVIVVVGSTAVLGGTAWFARKAIFEQQQLEILESGTVEEKQRAADLLIEIESEKVAPALARLFAEACERSKRRLALVKPEGPKKVRSWDLVESNHHSGASTAVRRAEGWYVLGLSGTRELRVFERAPFEGKYHDDSDEWIVERLVACGLPGWMALVDVLRDGGDRGRAGAARVLMGAPAEVSRQIARCLRESTLEIVLAGAFVLDALGGKAAPAMLDLLDVVQGTDDRDRRVLALQCLHVIADPSREVVEVLRRALADPDASVQFAAVESIRLGRVRDLPFRSSIETLTTHEVAAIRESARLILARAAGGGS